MLAATPCWYPRVPRLLLALAMGCALAAAGCGYIGVDPLPVDKLGMDASGPRVPASDGGVLDDAPEPTSGRDPSVPTSPPDASPQDDGPMDGGSAVSEGGQPGPGDGAVPAPADAGVPDTLLPTETVAARLSAGSDDACIIRANGDALCWGYDGNGERGDGRSTTDPQAAPTAVVQAETGALASIDMGYIHTCALATDGRAFCWGDNSRSQLGGASGMRQREPVAVAGAMQFGALSVGAYHACALDAAGDAHCWGDNQAGQLGLGTTGGVQSSPVPAGGSLAYSWIAAGKSHTCALDTQRQAYCWGEGGDGQLGRDSTGDSNSPVAVDSTEQFRSIEAGTTFTCALTTDDRALCWGSGGRGELGDGRQQDSNVPVPVAGGLRFASLTVAGEDAPGFNPAQHACALTYAGDAYCWGSNEYGQLGTSDAGLARALEPVSVDQSVSGPLVELIAGFGFTCARDENDGAWCWGFDGTGELGAGPGRQDSPTPVRVLLP